MAHGLPRATGGLDARIWTDSANAGRLFTALEGFGFGGVGIRHDDVTSDDCVVRLGYTHDRIDLLARRRGVEFDVAWRRHIDVVLDGVVVPFLGREASTGTSGPPVILGMSLTSSDSLERRRPGSIDDRRYPMCGWPALRPGRTGSGSDQIGNSPVARRRSSAA